MLYPRQPISPDTLVRNKRRDARKRTLSAAVDEHRSILNKVLWDIENLLELIRHLYSMFLFSFCVWSLCGDVGGRDVVVKRRS